MQRLWFILQVLIALPLLAAGIALREGAQTLQLWMQGLLALGLFGAAIALVVYRGRLAPTWVRVGRRAGKAVSQQGRDRTGTRRMEGGSNGGTGATGSHGGDERAASGHGEGSSGGGAAAGGGGRGGNGQGGNRGGGGGSGGNDGRGNGGGAPPPGDGLPDDVNRLIDAYLARGEMVAQDLVCPLEDLAEYVGRNPDQELWLQLVYGLNHDLPASHACFLAMVRHPACENAVAAALLDQMQADYYYALPPARARGLDPGAFEVIKAIGDRDGPRGFPATGIADSRRLDRATLRARFADITQDPDSILRLPWRLLMVTPSGPTPRERYLVDETGVFRVI